ELIGSDESNDIAVLKIDANGLTPVVLGTSDDIKVGDQVVAIGNPLGELTFSLTSGVVSALDREVTTEKATMNLIQTDCAINSGNSGGALFNMYGEVVGITNAKYSSGGNGEASIDNIGFAIPIDSVKSLVESLIEDGYITKPYIGVYVDNVSEDAVNYGLPKGASVKQIIEDSPAEKAGLKVNDIITEANGEEISSSNDLVKIVRKSEPGAKLVLKVYSQGEYKTVELLVEEKKQGQTDDASSEEDEQQYDPRMDEEYQEIDPFEEFGRMFGGY
ncbi:MAG: trypsin-like peptidase domain-containing protein, partial [Ruminococcus sp.]|nr:trypsin-like peptidase domain-containing protein [Ruminococcus sp.]